MARILSAAVVGAIIYYVWGMLAWMAIPLHGPTIAPLPAEQAVADLLREQGLANGVYVAPFASDPADMGDPESEFMKRHATGPIFSIFYHQQGSTPMSAGMLFMGFVIDFVAALMAATLLSCVGPSCSSYRCRVGFVGGLGLFVAVIGHLSYWNWMYFPLAYTAAFMVDVTVGWTLAGLAMAALIAPATAPTSSDVAVAPQHSAKPEPKPAPAAVQPIRNDAVSLLAALQREARFVDIVKEPIDDYSDAQIGAAARDVLKDCATVLERLFQIEPIVPQAEGDEITVPENADPAMYRLTGNNQAKSGVLLHPGWRVAQCELPTWTGSREAAKVVAPADVEAK